MVSEHDTLDGVAMTLLALRLSIHPARVAECRREGLKPP